MTTIQDGYYLTVTDAAGGSIYGLKGAAFTRAQIAAGMTYADVQTPGGIEANLNNYFNTAAFTATPAIGNGTGWGNSGIGIARGPGQFSFDAALAKRTIVGGIREGAELQFRAEAFNLFNHPQFNPPGLDRGVGGFGQIVSTSVNPRILQLGLKYVF